MINGNANRGAPVVVVSDLFAVGTTLKDVTVELHSTHCIVWRPNQAGYSEMLLISNNYSFARHLTDNLFFLEVK